MTHHALLPTTFAGFPAHDDQTPEETQIAVIGVPYLSPYPLEKSYDSQNAVSTIRHASLTYKKTDHFDFDFGGSLLGEAPVRCVDYGNLVRESEPFHEYSHSITRAIRELLAQGTIPLVIGGDHGTTIPVLKAYDAFKNLCVVQIDAHLDFVEVVPERDLANLTSLFAARQLLNFIGVVAHSGQFPQRRPDRPA